MENQVQIQLVRRLFEEVFNQGKINVLEELLATDVKVFDPSVPNFRGGAQGYKDREQIYHQAFPGKQLTIEEIFMADNDRVVVYWRGQGMQSGDLQDLLATDRTFCNVTGISVYTLKDGKISEIHQNWDRLSLLEQLGAVEASAQALHR